LSEAQRGTKEEEKMATMEEKTTPTSVGSLDEPKEASESTKTEDQPHTSHDDKEVFITGIKLYAVICAVTLVAFLMLLDMSIIATAIPRITTQFHSLPDVGWYGASYLLASCSLQPLAGKIYTIFNNKWTFLIFFSVFELGSLISGVATSSNMLIVGRAIAGMGSAGMTNGALTIIAACVPLQKRPIYLGFMMATAQTGIILGPLIGGLLTQYTTWRWCFYINLPLGGLVAAMLILISIPDKRAKSDEKLTYRTVAAKMDLLGFVVFAPAAIQCLLALEWGGTRYRWSSPTIIGLFCGAAGTLALFLFVEYRKGDSAMVPFFMIRQRIIACSSVLMFFFAGSMFILTYYLPIYFQAVRGATPTMSGVYLLPSVLTQIIFAMSSGAMGTSQSHTVQARILITSSSY
jgi:MFS family permease